MAQTTEDIENIKEAYRKNVDASKDYVDKVFETTSETTWLWTNIKAKFPLGYLRDTHHVTQHNRNDSGALIDLFYDYLVRNRNDPKFSTSFLIVVIKEMYDAAERMKTESDPSMLLEDIQRRDNLGKELERVLGPNRKDGAIESFVEFSVVLERAGEIRGKMRIAIKDQQLNESLESTLTSIEGNMLEARRKGCQYAAFSVNPSQTFNFDPDNISTDQTPTADAVADAVKLSMEEEVCSRFYFEASVQRLVDGKLITHLIEEQNLAILKKDVPPPSSICLSWDAHKVLKEDLDITVVQFAAFLWAHRGHDQAAKMISLLRQLTSLGGKFIFCKKLSKDFAVTIATLSEKRLVNLRERLDDFTATLGKINSALLRMQATRQKTGVIFVDAYLRTHWPTIEKWALHFDDRSPYAQDAYKHIEAALGGLEKVRRDIEANTAPCVHGEVNSLGCNLIQLFEQARHFGDEDIPGLCLRAPSQPCGQLQLESKQRHQIDVDTTTAQMLKRSSSSPLIASKSPPTGPDGHTPGDTDDFDLNNKVDPPNDVTCRIDLWQSDDESCNVGSDDGNLSGCSSEALPVKSTFIHFDMPFLLSEYEGDEVAPWMLKRAASAPCIFMTTSLLMNDAPESCSEYCDDDDIETSMTPFVPNLMKAAHAQGECKPCAYFLLKKDGCRWGNECEFCHLCPAGELKKRKKEKAKALKLEEQKRRPKRYPVRYGRRPPWWGSSRKSESKPQSLTL